MARSATAGPDGSPRSVVARVEPRLDQAPAAAVGFELRGPPELPAGGGASAGEVVGPVREGEVERLRPSEPLAEGAGLQLRGVRGGGDEHPDLVADATAGCALVLVHGREPALLEDRVALRRRRVERHAGRALLAP